MIKRPITIFLLVVGTLIATVVIFIQSSHFAGMVKKIARKYVPSDLGVSGDFSELAVKLFPPGISIRNPEFKLAQKNIFQLPAQAAIKARRMDLNFHPFEMFSRSIRINEVVIIDGSVDLDIEPSKVPKKRESSARFHWDDFLKVRIEKVGLKDAKLKLSLQGSKTPADPFAVELLARSLSLGHIDPIRSEQRPLALGPAYELNVDLKQILVAPGKGVAPKMIESLEAKAYVDPQGLLIRNVNLSSDGIHAEASGSIDGNLLEPKGLSAETSLRIKGELSRVLPLLGEFPKEIIANSAGELEVNGKFKANLDSFAQTLRGDGNLTATDVRFQSWEADKVSVDASWSTHFFEIKRGVITAAIRKRNGGFQPGRGGKVEIGAFQVKAGSHENIEIPLKLEHAHIHWLAAPALKDVYPLDFRTSGTVGLIFNRANRANPWNVATKFNLKVEDFQLDNQKLAKNRPLKAVVAVPLMNLNGQAVIDSSGLKSTEATLTVNKSRMQATGSVTRKGGYDLQVNGNVALAEIGRLAGSDIRGEGGLSVRIHGPSSRVLVDFDMDLKNASYIHLNLGDVKGRITLDEDPNQLYFTKMQGMRDSTPYGVDGVLDFTDDGTIDLKANFPDGRIEDINRLVAELTKDLSWYPQSVTGELNGSLRITGGLDLDQLVIATKFNGRDWSYLGERFKSVSLRGGYDKGRYFAEDFKAIKRLGALTGRISYSKSGVIDWKLLSDYLSIIDLDHFTQLDIPIRGRLNITSTGSGAFGQIRSDTRIQLSDFVVRGVLLPPSELSVRSASGITEVKGSALGGQGGLEANYNFSPGSSSMIRCELKQLDFSPILLLLNPKSIQDPSLAGFISGSLDLQFRSGDIEHATGKAALSEFLLAKTGVRFSLAQPRSIRIDRGTFNIDDLSLNGNLGKATFSLSGHDGALSGKVSGDLDTSIAEFLTSAVSQASGTADLNFNIGGMVKAPTIDGRAVLNGSVLRSPSVESPFENINGAIALKQSVITVQNIEASLAGGRVNANGTIELFPDRYPEVKLFAAASDSKLKIYPFQFVKIRQARFDITGSAPPYKIGGRVIVDSALSREKLAGASQGGAGLRTMPYGPPLGAERESSYPKFALNVAVEAGNDLIFQNEVFDAELRASIILVNTLEAPRLLGRAELVQGKMSFKDHVFQLQSGTITFDSPTVINPAFNLMASSEVSGTRIQLYAAGRVDKYKVELSSNPAMPESEILSLLATGFTSEDSRRLRTGNLGAVQSGEAASLILHSLDFNRDVKDKTGIQIQVDEAVDTQTGSSIFRPQTDAESLAAPKIVIKRRIGKRFDVSVGSTVGAGATSQKEVNAELNVTNGFSVLGVWNSFEGANTQEGTRSYSYGMDLKLQKRFK